MKSINEEISTLSEEKRELLELLLKKEGLDLSHLSIPRRREAGFLPLSFSQWRMWSLGELTPGSSASNQALAFRIRGALDGAALRQSLNQVVDRHEILRTNCVLVNGQPGQVIAPSLKLAVPEVDLRELPEVDRMPEASRQATAEARRPFGLAKDPLLRATLFRLDVEDCVLLLATHQFVTDAFSLRVLLRELAALYRASVAGVASPLPELSIQYGDYAIWQREWLRGEVLEAELTYWKSQLSGAPSVLELPTDRPRPPVPSLEGDSLMFSLPHHLSQALRELSRREGVTLYMTLLAAFQTLLHGYTQQTDIVVCTPMAKRYRNEIETLIGNFANNLLLRTDFAGDPTFRELLERVSQATLDACAHPELPLERLIEVLQNQESRHRVPQVQVMFILRDSTPEQSLQLPGLTVTGVPIEMGATRLELILDVADGADGLTGTLDYSTELYDASTVAGILSDFRALLEGAVATPDQRVSSLRLPMDGRARVPFGHLPHLGTNQARPEEERAVVGPRDALELQLTKIWEQVLGVQPIGVEDSFFRLGGHSLLALQLFARIEKVWGKRLPLATLFQAPTVAAMADVLRQEGWSSPWSSLVPLQPRGSRRPFFITSPGAVLFFEELARHLGPDQPFYGLQAPGLEEGQEPLTRVEDLAAQYIKEIRSLQPAGPYLLSGLCLGGSVAFEMAQQLLAQGQEVGLLLILDSAPPQVVHRAPLASGPKLPRSPVRRFAYYLWRGELSRKLAQKALREQRRVTARSKRTWVRLFGSPGERRLQWFEEINEAVGARYVASVYPGRMVLLRSSEFVKRREKDTHLAWKELARGGLECHQVAGKHLGMFREPHVRVLAEQIRSHLDAVQGVPVGGGREPGGFL